MDDIILQLHEINDQVQLGYDLLNVLRHFFLKYDYYQFLIVNHHQTINNREIQHLRSFQKNRINL